MPSTNTRSAARPGMRRSARRAAAAGAAAVLTAGLLLGFSATAQARPSCISNFYALQTAFNDATDTASTVTFCSGPTSVTVDAASTSGLMLTDGQQLIVDLNGGTLTVHGSSGDKTDPTPGIRIDAGSTLVIINGTLTVAGGAGSAGSQGPAGGNGKNGGAGGPGGNATAGGNGTPGSDGSPGDPGTAATGAGTAGTNGAPGIANSGNLVITATIGDSSNGGVGGNGGNGGAGGNGGPGGPGGKAGDSFIFPEPPYNSYLGGTGGAGGAGGAGGIGGAGGVGGDGAPGIDNQGALYVSATGSTTAASGAGGANGNAGLDGARGGGGSGGNGAGGDGGKGGTGGAGGAGGAGAPLISGTPILQADAGQGSNPENLWLYSSGDEYPALGGVAAFFSAVIDNGWWPATRAGYTFAGWSIHQNGNPIIDPEDSSTNYSIIYAVWQAIQTTTSAPPPTTSTDSIASTTETTPPTSPGMPSPAPVTSAGTRSSAPLPADTDAADLQLSNHHMPAGSGVVITAHGFAPGTTVDFWIYSTPHYLGSAIADKTGTATLHVTLDASLVGVHHIQALGVGPQGQPRNLAQTITLTAAPLASTGINVAALLLLVLVLAGAGAGLLHVGSRRLAPRQH